jgi:ElaB/YqjD/DUF883 family membrane-anchored ribosome-binding protein
VGRTRARAGDWFEGARACVRRNPAESVAITLVAGSLLGWLLHSSRRA